MNIETFLILLLIAKQLSRHLVELSILNALLRMNTASFYRSHRRGIVHFSSGIFRVTDLGNRLFGLFFFGLLVLADLFCDEHWLFFRFIFLFLIFNLRNEKYTSESSEKRSSSLGSSSPKRAFFFFLNTLFSTLIIFSNLIGHLSAFLFLR